MGGSWITVGWFPVAQTICRIQSSGLFEAQSSLFVHTWRQSRGIKQSNERLSDLAQLRVRQVVRLSEDAGMSSEWSEMKRSAMQRLANSGEKNDWRCTRLAKNMSGGALSSYLPLMRH